MLYLARFKNELAPLLIDAANADDATALAIANAEEEPAELREVPAGVLMCEVRFADPVGDEDDANPANVSEVEMVLEPLDGFADWLASADAEALEEDPSRAPTEPAPVEDRAHDPEV